MKKIFKIVLVVIIVALLFTFSSPTRAIKCAALIQGCEWQEVVAAEFEEKDVIETFPTKVVYETDSSLLDELTGAGHSVWYVYKIVFINIPQWAGNG